MRVTLQYQETPGSPLKKITVVDAVSIGRSGECEIVIENPKVSRKHAQVVLSSDRLTIEDLNSANGTMISGSKIPASQKVELKNGMSFQIGGVEFGVQIEVEKESPYLIWYRIDQGDWKKQTFADTLTIGRDDSCGLSLAEDHVSREHCQIINRDGNFYIIDNGSQNGTYLEKNKIPPRTAQVFYPGQYLTIGHVTMTLAEAQRQNKFENQISRYRTGEIVSAAVPAAPKPKKKGVSVWPFLIGAGMLMMACVCVVIVGGLFLFQTPESSPTAVANDWNDLVSSEDAPDITVTAAPANIEQLESATPQADEEAVSNEGEQKLDWLVLLYQNADDENLEEDIVFDVNSAEYIGSSETVKIVTQLDRFEGSYSGDGNWSQSRRYILEKDENLEQIQSSISADLGEVDSGDVQTLIDFVLWADNEYSAEHVILVLSDHGGGWFGGYTDGDNGNVDGIYLPALENALAYLVANSSLSKFDIIGFDACLMAQLEVYSILSPYADIVVASEETESATGWAYAAFLERLIKNPGMSAEDLSQNIVDTFVEQDIYYDYYGLESSYTMDTSTLSAFDLEKISIVNQAFNQFVVSLEGIDPATVAEARTYTRSYLLYEDYEPSFIDLAHFGDMVCAYSGDQGVCQQANALKAAIDEAVLAEKHGDNMTGSHGISFYFPDSDFFEITMDDSYGYAYRKHAERFVENSIWDEFLDYHYLGRSMP